MSTYNLSIYLTGKNSRAIQVTGPITDATKSIQILRSFSPSDTQSTDDTKLYGVNPEPLFQVYIDDPYNQSNRLGEDTDDWEILGKQEPYILYMAAKFLLLGALRAVLKWKMNKNPFCIGLAGFMQRSAI